MSYLRNITQRLSFQPFDSRLSLRHSFLLSYGSNIYKLRPESPTLRPVSSPSRRSFTTWSRLSTTFLKLRSSCESDEISGLREPRSEPEDLVSSGSFRRTNSILTESKRANNVVQGTADLQQQVLDEGSKSSVCLATKKSCRVSRREIVNLGFGFVDGTSDGFDVGDEGRRSSLVLDCRRVRVEAGCRLVCVGNDEPWESQCIGLRHTDGASVLLDLAVERFDDAVSVADLTLLCHRCLRAFGRGCDGTQEEARQCQHREERGLHVV